MPGASAQRIDTSEESAGAIVDVARPNRDSTPGEALLRAVAASGLSTARILQDYARLAFGPGRLSFNDYIRLRLFDERLYANVDKRAFVGARMNREIAISVNYRHDWFGMLASKIASAAYLRTYGLPTIPMVAVYGENLGLPTDKLLRRPNELLDLLRQESIYPLFAKPVESYQSLGSASLQAYHPARNTIRFVDGREVGLEDFVSYIRRHYAHGYVLQPLMTPQAAVRRICGDRLATIRVLTILTEDGPKIARVSWKIPAGANAADNFWRKGNLLAQVDRKSGEVGRALCGSGLELVEVSRHPDSQIELAGFALPNWPSICEVALAGARLMRHVPLIGWDMASTDAGALIVEMNETPDFLLHQLADRRGMLDEEFSDFIAFQKANATAHVKAMRTAVEKL